MPPLHRVPAIRSARTVWLLVMAIVLASATASNAHRPGPLVRPAGDLSLRAVGGAAVAGSDSGGAASDRGGHADPGAPVRAATRPRAMSMDAPIQGGLTAHQAQAVSSRLYSTHVDAPIAAASPYWTPAMGRTAVARARSWLGLPYSWAGGNAAGPTRGRCQSGDGGDLDCHFAGFDCSGLTMYAWGPYGTLSHLAETQRAAGAFRPSVGQLLPGDLVFFAGYLPGGVGHVAIYEGGGGVIEAPQSGSVVRRSALSTLMAEDGGYRGSVRPLTAPTPVLAAPTVAVPARGGLLVLRGSHLSGVDSVRLGGADVRSFMTHTDSVIALRAPSHHAGRVAVSATTTWLATSRAVGLTYAAARRVSSTPGSVAAAPRTIPAPSREPLPSVPAPRPQTVASSSRVPVPANTSPSAASTVPSSPPASSGSAAPPAGG